MSYLALDTETGGIGPEADLLTAYFAVFNEDFHLVDELDLSIRPQTENDFFSVSAKSLEINKINLVDHFKTAETKSVAGAKLRNFLVNNSKQGRLIPVGHNIAFDIEKVNSRLLNKRAWDLYVGYRKLDTGTIGQFLMSAGILPKDMKASLSTMVKYFDLKFKGEEHTARADTLATIDVLKAQLNLIKNTNTNIKG